MAGRRTKRPTRSSATAFFIVLLSTERLLHKTEGLQYPIPISSHSASTQRHNKLPRLSANRLTSEPNASPKTGRKPYAEEFVRDDNACSFATLDDFLESFRSTLAMDYETKVKKETKQSSHLERHVKKQNFGITHNQYQHSQNENEQEAIWMERQQDLETLNQRHQMHQITSTAADKSHSFTMPSSFESSSMTSTAGGTSTLALVMSGKEEDDVYPSTLTATLDQVDHCPSSDINDRNLSNVWRARLLLLGAAALYGSNFSLVKLLGDTMPVSVSTTLRFGLAALAVSPFLFLPSEAFRKTTSSASCSNESSKAAVGNVDYKMMNDTIASDTSNDMADTLRVLWLGFEVGLWNSVGYVAQAVGLETTLASKSAFICSMAVVVVPLLDFMTGKTLLSRQWVGAIMALIGVAFLELGGGDDGGTAIGLTNDLGTSFLGQWISTGDALSLIQPLVFGIGFWRMEKAMHMFPTEAPRLTAAQLLAVFLSSLLYALSTLSDGCDLTTLPSTIMALPWSEWLTDTSILFSIFWTGCITTALTIYMETLALETLSAAETTLIFSTEPLWGTAFAALVMGETLGVNAAFGAAFILAACLYSNLGMDGVKKIIDSSIAVAASNNTMKNKSLKRPTDNTRSSMIPKKMSAWLTSGLAGGLATWNVASNTLQSNEISDIVDDLMETLVDKLP